MTRIRATDSETSGDLPDHVTGVLSAPDGDVDRRAEPGRRHARAGRAHKLHRLRRTEKSAEAARPGPSVIARRGGVPPGVVRRCLGLDDPHLAAAQLPADQGAHRERDARAVRRGREVRTVEGLETADKLDSVQQVDEAAVRSAVELGQH